MRFQGTLYRALNPLYAREPLSGRGAQLYGGRFNAKGVPALYLTLDVQTAIREANQVGSLQPTTLVAYDADIDDVFDSRDVGALAAHGLTPGDLAATTWRDEMRSTGRSKTQSFAADLFDSGHSGLLVRSFARGSTETDLNLVLWRWEAVGRCRLTVVDDERRLG
jgi:RES domain-containing protein